MSIGDHNPIIQPRSFTGPIAYCTVLNFIFTQMTATKGVKNHGERTSVATYFMDLKQLNDRMMPEKPVIESIHLKSLPNNDEKSALEAVYLIKEKCCIPGAYLYANFSDDEIVADIESTWSLCRHHVFSG